MSKTTSSQLRELLDSANKSPIQAIVQLRMPERPEAVPTAVETSELATRVLERVALATNSVAGKTNILKNLATVVVEAEPEFIRVLIEQPEVIYAMPNQISEELFIPPSEHRGS